MSLVAWALSARRGGGLTASARGALPRTAPRGLLTFLLTGFTCRLLVLSRSVASSAPTGPRLSLRIALDVKDSAALVESHESLLLILRSVLN